MTNDASPAPRPAAVVRILEALIVACMACMLVLVFGNVVMRYIFNSGISISEELSRMLFVWMTFIGAIVAVAEGTHLGMDSVVQRLPPAWALAFALLSDIAIVVCCVLLGQGAWTQTQLNMGNVAPVSGIPLGYVHLAVLVASIGIVLIVSGHTWRLLRARAHDAASGTSAR
ncbi:MAG: Tripartite ATP-independent periplasmic transporter DctQ component [Ramlibacter sp.]|nr:Tripartite ATP-independent periplasmic transporter DctQ component [Ramlibacter sp.]